MKFAIALYSAAHAPSSRRALLFAQAALAGGHEIVRLFFYQDGVYSASNNIVAPRMSKTLRANGANLSASTGSTAWCASPPRCAAGCLMPKKLRVTNAARSTWKHPGRCRAWANCMTRSRTPTA